MRKRAAKCWWKLLPKATARQRVPHLHLVFAGPADGAYAGRLQNAVARFGIEAAVTWTGMLHGDLKWGAFRSAEAFILPSHQENFGVAVAEALACGLPVLISDKVNIYREIAADGAGLVEADDLAGTRRLLERWLGLRDEERQAMGPRAIASRSAADTRPTTQVTGSQRLGARRTTGTPSPASYGQTRRADLHDAGRRESAQPSSASGLSRAARSRWNCSQAQ